jgi:DNA-binding transcriptional MerR regulator
VSDQAEPGVLRIGELSRRVGVSEHVLRAWESRYGLLSPVRSPGGFRLYSEGDEQRVRRMQFHLERGLAAAEAARAAITEGQAPSALPIGARRSAEAEQSDLETLAADLRSALDALDEPAAQAVLDRLMSDFTLATALRDVVMPYLRELGERWADGELTIVQEHFASNVLRGRLAGFARGWGNGDGPRAVLACPPDEFHDLPLLIFGIILNRRGWRVDFFGVNTPVVELVDGARRSPPDLIVVAAAVPERFSAIRADLADLAGVAPLALAGAGASSEAADAVGARLLTGDPVTAAQQQHGRRP